MNMSNTALGLILTLSGSVDSDSNVIFEPAEPTSDKMEYDSVTGIITFNEPGTYLLNWWIATETVPHGKIEFALSTSQGDYIRGSSPLKTGQISGYGSIDVTAGTTLSLINASEYNIVFSRGTKVKAYLLVSPIPSLAGVRTIIPFSTGERPIMLVTTDNGERTGVSVLGFGSAGELDAPDDPIVFALTSGAESYYAFSMPTNGIITSLSAKFILYSVVLPVDNTITAQLYYSLTLDNTFFPVPGATIELGTILSNDTPGKVLYGSVTDLSVPIPAQASLMLIFYNTADLQETALVRGVMQGGLLIT